MSADRLPQPCRLDLIGSGEQLVDRSKLRKQLGRRFRSDTRNSRDVIHRVTRERQPVHDLIGSHARFLDHLRRTRQRADLGRRDHAHAVRDQLEKIFIARGDQDTRILRLGPTDEGGHGVVRLVSIHAYRRDL